MKANPKIQRRGRKKGSKTTWTTPGAPLDENLTKAVFGPLHKSDGSAFSHQAWIILNPQPQIRRNLELSSPTKADLDAALITSATHFLAEAFAPEAAKRIMNGDIQFFRDFAAMVDQCCKGAVPFDPQRAGLAAYVLMALKGAPKRKFSRTELLDPNSGPDWGGQRPEYRQLIETCIIG